MRTVSGEVTTAEALSQAKAMRRSSQIESHFGQLYAEPKKASGDQVWNVRVRGDNNSSQVYSSGARKGTRILATLRTRNKRAVLEMMNALEVFHRAGVL